MVSYRPLNLPNLRSNSKDLIDEQELFINSSERKQNFRSSRVKMKMDIHEIWRHQSDQQLRNAAAKLLDYREDVQLLIQNELKLRGLLEDPTLVIQKPPSPPSRLLLLDVFNITEKDIAINRQGRLSIRQQAYLQAVAIYNAKFFVTFGIVFAIVMYGLLYVMIRADPVGARQALDFSENALLKIFILSMTPGLPTVALLYGIHTIRVAQRSKNTTHVQSITGAIQLDISRTRQGVSLYEIQVQNQSFLISAQAYTILKTGQRCCVYYEPIVHSIVAIEPAPL